MLFVVFHVIQLMVMEVMITLTKINKQNVLKPVKAQSRVTVKISEINYIFLIS